MKTITRCLLLAIFLLSVSRAPAQGGFSMPEGIKQMDIPFEYVNNFIIVTVVFNGILPLKMIFDTGAEHTILSKREISDFLKVNYEREFRLLGSDLKTELVAYLARQIRLETPNLPFVAPKEDILVLQEDYFRFEEYAGVNVHGILSAQTFSKYIFKINYQRKVITLYDREAFRLNEPGFQAVPVEVYRNKIYLTTPKAGFIPDTATIKLLLDTGAGLPLLLFSNTHPMVHPPKNAIPSNIGMGLGGFLEGYVGRTQSLQIGNFTQNGIITYYQALDTAQNLNYLNNRNGLVGNMLLNHFQLVIDYAGSTIWLKPSKAFKENFQFDRSGLNIVASGVGLNQFTVQGVIPGSPADVAGILSGDRIVKIGLMPTSVLTLHDLQRIFFKKPGKKVKITVKRNGARLKKEFVLRDLI